MSSPTHSYYDWQVSTLLLAYDVATPIARHEAAALAERQQKVELELHALAHSILPADFLQNPDRELPPEQIMEMTKATLRRAAAIVGL